VHDKNRLDAIEKEHNIKILTIWEKEYNEHKDETIQKCLDFLSGKYD
jgi:hypothetical protein